MAEFSFITTPYQGFEEEILRLRNRNRSAPVSRLYIDWRYLGQNTETQPEIFWVKTSNGALVGMASLIYRPYWVNDSPYEFMVVGDISLDKNFRGTGLADKFFLYIKEQIQQKTSPCAMVIPNAAASKANSRNGWFEKDQLIHHVLLLKPEKKIRERVKVRILSSILSRLYLLFLKRKLRAVGTDGLTLNIVSNFDGEFDKFWDSIKKINICLRDRTSPSLKWRYCDRPASEPFSIVTCHIKEKLSAYLVYSANAETKTLTVYDLMALHEKYISGFLKLFIGFVNKNINVDSIRISLNKCHPYCRYLKKIGFSARKGGQLIQILIPNHAEVSLGGNQWVLTAGDKDA